ncbi:hypothetical protein [Aquimarina sp. RZ0]|uniref:hypothetical protein n=1 Tax=Aquimarina sp. RZ0 TaxID=2607730 RepID=UPI0011F1CC05|nr:hypothetical protein [Aquimarina sp. RZ0]KAA1242777.1 hypothetical protein F0000_24175 [Aquimarina sp. RZ0]
MIFIFKTSVQNKKQVKELKPYLDKIPIKSQWSFDLEDSDKILRIDSENCSAKKIIKLLENLNFECEELE